MSTALPSPATAAGPSFGPANLGYAIAVALGFLVLFSAVLLASYICLRYISDLRRRTATTNRTQGNGIHLPRIVFVTEDGDNVTDHSAAAAAVGLDESVISSYPKLVWKKLDGISADDAVCSICLAEYKESETLRMLPECRHTFHAICVDPWLKLNASCPVCRNSPIPTPLSTPLQEVVPLSQYSDARRWR